MDRDEGWKCWLRLGTQPLLNYIGNARLASRYAHMLQDIFEFLVSLSHVADFYMNRCVMAPRKWVLNDQRRKREERLKHVDFS